MTDAEQLLLDRTMPVMVAALLTDVVIDIGARAQRAIGFGDTTKETIEDALALLTGTHEVQNAVLSREWHRELAAQAIADATCQDCGETIEEGEERHFVKGDGPLCWWCARKITHPQERI